MPNLSTYFRRLRLRFTGARDAEPGIEFNPDNWGEQAPVIGRALPLSRTRH